MLAIKAGKDSDPGSNEKREQQPSPLIKQLKLNDATVNDQETGKKEEKESNQMR